MLEKLVQATVITFLLYLIAGVNYNARNQSNVKAPAAETPTTIISFLWNTFP